MVRFLRSKCPGLGVFAQTHLAVTTRDRRAAGSFCSLMPTLLPLLLFSDIFRAMIYRSPSRLHHVAETGVIVFPLVPYAFQVATLAYYVL